MKFMEVANGSGVEVRALKLTRESVAGFSLEFRGWRVSVERPAFVPTSEESKPAIKIEVIPSTESAELPEPPAEPEAQLNLPPVAHGPAEYDYWIEDGQDYCAQW